MKKFSFTLLALAIYSCLALAQVVTTQPTLPTADNEVLVTFNATGTALEGYNGNVYAHTGLICEGEVNWQYVIGSWGNNSVQPKLTKIGTDLYTLSITPTIREFYSASAGEVIQKMAFVFRTQSSPYQQTTPDIFVNVFDEGLSVNLSNPSSDSPFYALGENITISAQANMSESLYLYINGNEITSTTESWLEYIYEVEDYGMQWVKVVAWNQGAWVADSAYIYTMGEVPEAPLPNGLLPGVNITAENEVTLVLSDPPATKDFVFVIGDFNDWQLDDTYLMNRTPDGSFFWLPITNLAPSQEYIYQYWVDGNLKLADPFSEKISDPWNDKWISPTNYPNLIQYPEGKTTGVASTLQIQQEEYNWEVEEFIAPAKHELVIYELLIRDFVEGDDIKSVTGKLDYLQSLGVNAIELMPINEFEGNDSWGYNPAFYFATDKAYGRKNDYKKFIDECHKRGIAVIIDMVLNHSFGLSPMVQMYFDSSAGNWGQPTPENPWYNATCPHEPWCWGYDFDHESEHTRGFIDRVAEFWLTEFRVDGFRLDFTKGFTNVQTPNQGWNYDNQRIGILKRFADHIWGVNPSAYVILEHFTDNSEERELAEYRLGEGKGMLLWGNMNYNYNEATMGWLDNSNFSNVSYKQRGWSAPHLIGYMESHDEERLMYKNTEYGNSQNSSYNIRNLEVALERQKLAGWFFFTIPGPKMIWQFGELGYDYSINYCSDGTTDESCRTYRKPIRWDYLNVPARWALYNSWKEVIALRQALPVFQTANFNISFSGAGKYMVLNDGEMKVVVVGNFSNTPQNVSVTFPQAGQWYSYFEGNSTNFAQATQSFNLQPGEYRMYSTVFINRNDFNVGINDNTISNGNTELIVSAWPNPAESEFHISLNTNAEQSVSVTLFDLTGREVASLFRGKVSPNRNIIQSVIPSNLPVGIYICRVKTEQAQQSIKLVIR